MLHTRALALAWAALLLAAAAASANPLDVKTGLWESTFTSESSGLPPLDMSKLTPEQKAHIEAVIKARGGEGPQTRTTKSCLTKEKLAEDPFGSQTAGQTCTTKQTTRTSTRWEIERTCVVARRKTEVVMSITAESRESVKGTTLITVSDGAHKMQIHGTVAGKWLGADCGNIK